MDIQLKRGLLDVCVLAAIKDEDSYLDNYANLSSASAFSTTDPWLQEINCPTVMPLVSFYCDGISTKAFRELTDDEVPEKVKYKTLQYTHEVMKN